MTAATHDMLTGSHECLRAPAARQGGIAARIGRTLDLWRARIRDREAFAALNDRDLHELHLSRWEVQRELAKPFWRG
jgi:uncharacterized protein YjiS (DUF1127 family)